LHIFIKEIKEKEKIAAECYSDNDSSEIRFLRKTYALGSNGRIAVRCQRRAKVLTVLLRFFSIEP